MKLLMKPIEMIAWFSKEDYPIPLRYRIQTKEFEDVVVKIDSVLYKEEQRLPGNKLVIYKCQGIVNNFQRVFEIRYEISTCKWYLYKF